MASWPSTLPAPQKSISITPGDTRKDRRLQSGRTEFRRFGDGKPDEARVPFRLTWAEWDIFKEFYAHDLNLGINWFSADWLADLGYDAHKAKILGYPREVALQSYYVDVLCTLLIQKTAWIVGEDSEWPCLPTGGEYEPPPPPTEKGYIFGGGVAGSQNCDEYDSVLNSWAHKTSMPAPARYGAAASTISDAGYVYAGYGGAYLRDCDKYDPDIWTSKTNMPTPGRFLPGASTIGSKSYVYGGETTTNCDEYEPIGNAWTTKASVPLPQRGEIAASTINNKGYIYGGYTQDCDEYDPITNSWAEKAPTPYPAREALAASTIGSSGYIYGGGGSGAVYLQDCDEYIPSYDTWNSKTSLPSPGRERLSGSTIGSSGYVYGGKYSVWAINDCDEYTPDMWVSMTNMLAGIANLTATTI